MNHCLNQFLPLIMLMKTGALPSTLIIEAEAWMSWGWGERKGGRGGRDESLGRERCRGRRRERERERDEVTRRPARRESLGERGTRAIKSKISSSCRALYNIRERATVTVAVHLENYLHQHANGRRKRCASSAACLCIRRATHMCTKTAT